MPSYAGFSSPPLSEGSLPTSPHFGNRTFPRHGAAILGQVMSAGVKVDTQPISAERGHSHGGFTALQFGFLDFYNDIHFEPGRIDVGNTSGTTVNIRVFNAYLTPRRLNDITFAGDMTGITLIEEQATPFYFRALQLIVYDLVISDTGPPQIDVAITFDFDVVDYTIPVVGSRILAWRWEPDWTQPVIERIEHLTDVMPSRNGYEQRRALRQVPRWAFRFQFMERARLRALLENALYATGAKIWAVPIFTDGAELLADAEEGEDSIAVETATRDFHVGGLAALINDNQESELVTIEAIASELLTLERPLNADWPAGTRVYPVRTGRLQVSQPYVRPTANMAVGEAQFVCDDAPVMTPLDEPLHRGFPVLEQQFNWIDPPYMSQERLVGIHDNQIRAATWEDKAGLPRYLKTGRWTAINRAEADLMRRFFHTRRGRYKSLWVPTWARDLEFLSVVTAASTEIEVQHRNLVNSFGADPGANRRDIRIELVDGTVLYRRITAFEFISATQERMTIDTALGVEVTPADVLIVSFMALSRMDADGVELAWENNAVANSVVNFRSFNNDV